MRTAEVARTAGVNPQTLRYYERIGLIERPPRTPGGYREYPPRVVEVLRFVLRAKELGFQLDEIEGLLGLADTEQDNCEAVRSFAEERMLELDRRIEDLQRMRGSLGQLIAGCEARDHVHCCPILQSLEQR